MKAKPRPTTKHDLVHVGDLFEIPPRWAVDLRGDDGVIATQFFVERLDAQLYADKHNFNAKDAAA